MGLISKQTFRTGEMSTDVIRMRRVRLLGVLVGLTVHGLDV